MKNHNQVWFTLIELLIVITIMLIISLTVFAPYAHYMNKAKIKYTNKELSQVIYEAKNMAKNWSVSYSWNVSVGIYFEKDAYSLYSYKHDIANINITPENGQLIRKYMLQPWVQIDNFAWENKWIIFFRSITWSGMILAGNSYSVVWNNELLIDFSYKWSQNDSLKNSLQYFQDTQIVDY